VPTRRALRQGRKRREADQRGHQEAHAAPVFPAWSHQRYPPAKGLVAVDADAARPRQQAVDRSTSIAFLDAGTKLGDEDPHSLVTDWRATRFWIASKARP
jgi:hypothetical protein